MSPDIAKGYSLFIYSFIDYLTVLAESLSEPVLTHVVILK